MQTNPHTIISSFTGAIAVNIATPLDPMFTANMIGDLIMFGFKALSGAVISILINKYVDYRKSKNKTTTPPTQPEAE